MDAAKSKQYLINEIRKLNRESSELDIKKTYDLPNKFLPGFANYNDRAELNLAVLDVRDRGYTGESALVKRGLLDIKEISDGSLKNLENRLRVENKDISLFGAGSLSSERPTEGKDDILERGAGVGVDSANELTDRASDAGIKGAGAANDVVKTLKSGMKTFDVLGKVGDASEVLRGLSLAGQIRAEQRRRVDGAAKNNSNTAPLRPSIDEEETSNEERDGPEQKPNPGPQSSMPAPETESLSADAARLRDAFMPLEGAPDDHDTLLLKSPEVLTEDEVRDLHFAYWDAPGGDPLRDDINDKLTGFYETTYGTDPVPLDDTGKAIDPEPKRTIPKQPSSVTTADGGTLTDGLKRVAETLTRTAQSDGTVPAVKSLQKGLNTLGQKLKVDGDPGPKTMAAVRQIAVKQGPGRIEEATALGAFNQFASTAKGGQITPKDLDAAVRTKVEPLLKAPTKLITDQETNRSMIAGQALQRGLNDLGLPGAKPLKEDGVPGPKTAGAFQSALALYDPDDVTASFSNALGFS